MADFFKNNSTGLIALLIGTIVGSFFTGGLGMGALLFGGAAMALFGGLLGNDENGIFSGLGNLFSSSTPDNSNNQETATGQGQGTGQASPGAELSTENEAGLLQVLDDEGKPIFTDNTKVAFNLRDSAGKLSGVMGKVSADKQSFIIDALAPIKDDGTYDTEHAWKPPSPISLSIQNGKINVNNPAITGALTAMAGGTPAPAPTQPRTGQSTATSPAAEGTMLQVVDGDGKPIFTDNTKVSFNVAGSGITGGILGKVSDDKKFFDIEAISLLEDGKSDMEKGWTRQLPIRIPIENGRIDLNNPEVNGALAWMAGDAKEPPAPQGASLAHIATPPQRQGPPAPPVPAGPPAPAAQLVKVLDASGNSILPTDSPIKFNVSDDAGKMTAGVIGQVTDDKKHFKLEAVVGIKDGNYDLQSAMGPQHEVLLPITGGAIDLNDPRFQQVLNSVNPVAKTEPAEGEQKFALDATPETKRNAAANQHFINMGKVTVGGMEYSAMLHGSKFAHGRQEGVQFSHIMLQDKYGNDLYNSDNEPMLVAFEEKDRPVTIIHNGHVFLSQEGVQQMRAQSQELFNHLHLQDIEASAGRAGLSRASGIPIHASLSGRQVIVFDIEGENSPEFQAFNKKLNTHLVNQEILPRADNENSVSLMEQSPPGKTVHRQIAVIGQMSPDRQHFILEGITELTDVGGSLKPGALPDNPVFSLSKYSRDDTLKVSSLENFMNAMGMVTPDGSEPGTVKVRIEPGLPRETMRAEQISEEYRAKEENTRDYVGDSKPVTQAAPGQTQTDMEKALDQFRTRQGNDLVADADIKSLGLKKQSDEQQKGPAVT